MNPSADSCGAILDRKGIATLLLLVAAVGGVCWWDLAQPHGCPADLIVRKVDIGGLLEILTRE